MIEEAIMENGVIIENGKIKTIFCDDVENNGEWLSIEEVDRLLTQSINKAQNGILHTS